MFSRNSVLCSSPYSSLFQNLYVDSEFMFSITMQVSDFFFEFERQCFPEIVYSVARLIRVCSKIYMLTPNLCF